MPASIIGAAIAATTIEAGALAFGWATFAKAFAISVVLRVAGSALGGKKSSASPYESLDSGARLQTIRQAISPRQIVFGSDRVGGDITFLYHDDAYNGIVITWTGVRVKAVRQLIANDEGLTQDDDGWMVQGKWRGFFGYESATGSEVGQPFPNAVRWSSGEWTENHLQAGCAKTHIHIAKNREVFPNGIPNFTAVIDGYDDIYDPRTASNGFTRNPALIAACFLTTVEMYEAAGAWSTINETALIAAANVCDERVSTVYQPAFTVSAAADEITFTADETQFVDGDALKYVSSGGAAGGLTSGSVYYFFRTDTDKGKLAATRDDALAQIAIDLTSAGTGTQTLERCNTFTVDTTRDRVTFDVSEKRLEYGDGVRLETTGSLPTGFSTGTTYYVIPISDTQIQLATSVTNAYAGIAINITSNGSGTHRLRAYDEVRYACDGSFRLDQNPRDILDQIQDAMAGLICKVGSVWEISAGAYTAPSVTFTESDLDGPIEGQVMLGRRESANGLKGVYVSRENFWQPTDFAPVDNATYLTEDNDTRVWKDIRFTMVRGHNRTRRLAKIELARIREGFTITIRGKLRVFRAKPGVVIGLTISRYGWTNQPFLVINCKPMAARQNEQGIYWGTDLTLQMISSGRYDWSATENTAAPVTRNTRLPDPFDLVKRQPPRVSGLEIPGQGFDGTFTGRDCTVQWRRVGINNRFEIGSEPDIFGANAGSLDYWIEGYRVMITSAADAIYRDDPTIFKDNRFTYTAEQNRADQVLYTGDADAAPVREFHILVYAKSRMGLFSAVPARILVNNPEPTTSNVALTATVDGFQFQYDRPTDTDWVGIEICASTSNGFTPDTAAGGNLVYKGADVPATVRGLASGTEYFYQYRLRDQFGAGSWSGESSITTEVATTQGISTQHVGAITLPSSSEANRVLGSLLLSRYPTLLPATLSAHCLGQATAGGSDSVVTATFRALAVASTPSVAGTLALSFSAGSLFALVGTGTDFTQLAASDWILLGTGEPLFRIHSVQDATHAKVQIFPGVPSPNVTYTFSGSFTAYRGTDLGTIASGSTSWLLPASTRLPFDSPGQKTLSTSGAFTGLLVVALGVTDLAGTTADYTTVTAEWKTGAA